MAQQLAQNADQQQQAPAAAQPEAGVEPIEGELVPTLNGYMRSRVFREPLPYTDCIRALAEAARLADATPGDEEATHYDTLEARAAAARVLPRLVLFGALPPSSLPTLVATRRLLDNPSAKPASVDRKLLRLAGYLLQLAAGEGSAGTPVPFSPLIGNAAPLRAVDVYEPSALDAVWAQARSEDPLAAAVAGASGGTDGANGGGPSAGAAAAAAAAARVAPHQRAAAFRALAALSRSSLVADAGGGGDVTLVTHLMAAAATTLDRADAARRRNMPFSFGGPPPSSSSSAARGGLGARNAERLAALERTAAARVALCASRVGLPRNVLASKMAPRAFGLVNSPDALCARHALAVCAAAARENPHAYAEALGAMLEVNVQQFRETGSLAGLADPSAAAALESARQALAEAHSAAAAAAPASASAADGGGGGGVGAAPLPVAAPPSKPIRPSKDALLKGEARCVNALDAWARVYLARGCGAVVHGGGWRGGNNSNGNNNGNSGGGGQGGNPFWETLVALACCDRSTVVAMEAVRALSGAGFPRASEALKPAGGKRAAPVVDEQRERADAAASVAAWHLLLARAEDEAPPAAAFGAAAFGVAGAAAADVADQFAAARLARGLPETPALARLCADPEEEEERRRQGMMLLVLRRQQQPGGASGGAAGGGAGGGDAPAVPPSVAGGPLAPAAAAALAFVAERRQNQQQQQQQQQRQQSAGGNGGSGGTGNNNTGGGFAPAVAAVLPELPPPAGPLTLLGAIAQRLLASLSPGASQAAMCSASRAVACLAEARARAASQARSPEEREALLGGPTARAVLGALEDRMLSIARGDAGSAGGGAAAAALTAPGSGAAAPPAAHLRSLALSALLWFQVLPGAASRLPPARVTEWLSSGGGSVAPAVRGIFADPWPEDVVAAFVHQLHRRLAAAPSAGPYLLACAAAAAAAAPSRAKHEQLHAMWDFCLRQQQQQQQGAMGASWAATGGGGGANGGASAGQPGPGATAAVRAALSRLSAPLPAVAQPPSAAAPEVKAFAAREEVGHWALARSAAWWLGENANFACGEFAWAPRRVPEEMADALADWGSGRVAKRKKRAGRGGGRSSSSGSGSGSGGGRESSDSGSNSDDVGSIDVARRRRRRRPNPAARRRAPVLPAGQELLAAAAASTNPLLTVVIAHLQRALVAGTWEVRVAAAQALAKVAVRSGEPFRVQCYALLAGAAPAARAGLAAPGAAAAASGGSKGHQQQQQQQQQQSGGGASAARQHEKQRDAGIAAPAPSLARQQHHHRGSDALGVAAAVAPALEVLDALYAGEVAVEGLARQYGRRRRAWPRSALAALERRNRALLAAVLERVCFVPQDSYWPLGALARDVLGGRWDGEESTDDGGEAEEWGGAGDGAAAAEGGAAAGGGGADGGSAGGGGGGGGGEVIIATGEGVEERLEAERQRLEQLELVKKKEKQAREELEEAERRAKEEQAAEEEQQQQRQRGAYADSDDSDAPPAAAQRAAAADRLAGQLQGYDYDPSAAADAYDRDAAALQQQQQQQLQQQQQGRPGSAGAAGASRGALRGSALYDFAPEDDDEVAVAEGEALRVEWEEGGWMQVVRADGVGGLVPSAYVRLDEGAGAAGGARGGGGDDDDEDDEEIGDDDDSDVAAARGAARRRASQDLGQRRRSGGANEASPRAGGGGGGGGFQRRSTAAGRGGAGGAGGFGGGGFGGGYHAGEEEDRLGEREDREAGAVDIAMAVGRLGNESAELGRAEGRLEELEGGGGIGGIGGGGGFGGGGTANLPQLMALHEAIEGAVSRMAALPGPLGSDGRAMRRRLRARGLEMLSRVEALRRAAGGPGAAAGAGGAAGAGATPPSGVTPRGSYPGGAFSSEGGRGGGAFAGPSSPRGGAGGNAGEATAAAAAGAAVVAFAFDAEAEGELSVRAGERVAVEAEVDGWYSVVRESDGARGLVPASYVELG